MAACGQLSLERGMRPNPGQWDLGCGEMPVAELSGGVFLSDQKGSLKIWARGTLGGGRGSKDCCLECNDWNYGSHHETPRGQVENNTAEKRVCAKIPKPLPNAGMPCLQVVL